MPAAPSPRAISLNGLDLTLRSPASTDATPLEISAFLTVLTFADLRAPKTSAFLDVLPSAHLLAREVSAFIGFFAIYIHLSRAIPSTNPKISFFLTVSHSVLQPLTPALSPDP